MVAEVSHRASRLSKDLGEFAKQNIIPHSANCMENTQPSSFRVKVESQRSMQHSCSRVASIREDAEIAMLFSDVLPCSRRVTGHVKTRRSVSSELCFTPLSDSDALIKQCWTQCNMCSPEVWAWRAGPWLWPEHGKNEKVAQSGSLTEVRTASLLL